MNHHLLRPGMRIAAAGVTASAAVLATIAASTPAGAATHAAAETVAYGGHAYGSHVTLGTQVNVGKTAYTPMCTTHAGTARINKTAKTDLGAAGYIGAVTSQLHSSKSGATRRSSATTRTAHTTLLGGVIKLSAVTTTASVAHHAHSYGSRGASTFVGLTIAGKSMPASAPANTTMALPGLGSVTLNSQHKYTKHGVRGITVTALNIKVGSGNPLGLPAGQIIIGRSTATLRLIHRVSSAAAYATQISVASVAGSGRTAAAYTPCGGTGTVTGSNDATGVTLPNAVASAHTARSTVTTTDTASKTTATGKNRLTGISLMSGAVKVQALTTQANASYSHGTRKVSAAGTKLLGLVVEGKAMGTPKSGTSQSVPGLGTLSFGYATKTKTGVVVYGLRLVLGSAQNGVPAGATITVGAARASVRK